MPRTTIDLDPAVLREIRRRSAHEGKTLGQIASDLLSRALATDDPLPAPDFDWVSADLGRPRIAMEDPESVRRALDTTPPPP